MTGGLSFLDQEEKSDINELIGLINSILYTKALPPNITEYTDKYLSFGKLVNDLLAIRKFTYELSNGELTHSLELRGYWPGALKALQSNLRHLAWQTSMVASGDYSQRVDFMGSFSTSFNSMIIRLNELTENEKQHIAELEKNQLIIKESERKYKLLADNTDDVIWLLNDKLKIHYISPSIEKLLGYTSEELEGKKITETPLSFLQALCEDNTSFLKTDKKHEPLIIEWNQLGKNRKMIWTESLVTIVQSNEGDFIGFLGVTRDISERRKTEGLLHQAYERKKKNDFFSLIINRNYTDDSEIKDLALQSKIYIPKYFSLLFLVITNICFEEDTRKQQTIDALIDLLNKKEDTIAWETANGIGIVWSITKNTTDINRNNREIEEAGVYIKYISAYFPDIEINIGIANYLDGWADFSKRLKNAETAIKISKQIWPDQKVCHYENCGIYQVLAPFTISNDAQAYVNKMIGSLIQHDINSGTELVGTLEKILSGLSFKEIGTQMFLHHKTIQLRKQRIEQILNISLDSYETRMALSTALQLMKLL